MNQRAIEQMTTATRGHADARRLLSGFPGLHDANGLTAAGVAFGSAYATAIDGGATGSQAEAAAKAAADDAQSTGETPRAPAKTRRKRKSPRR